MVLSSRQRHALLSSASPLHMHTSHATNANTTQSEIRSNSAFIVSRWSISGAWDKTRSLAPRLRCPAQDLTRIYQFMGLVVRAHKQERYPIDKALVAATMSACPCACHFTARTWTQEMSRTKSPRHMLSRHGCGSFLGWPAGLARTDVDTAKKIKKEEIKERTPSL